MAANYQSGSLPKNVAEASKKIALNAFMAAVLGIVIYMSVLFIYRSAGNPKIIGYTTTITSVDKDGNKTDTTGESYYFKDGEKHDIPKSNDSTKYSPLYTRDAFPEALSQILMFIVSTLMIYSVAWDFGSHCHNTAAADTNSKFDLRGLKIGVYSSFMYWLSLLLMLISKLFGEIPFTMPIYCLVNSSYLPLLNGFIYNEHGTYGLIAVFGNSPKDLSWLGVAVMLIPIIVKIGICVLGFELGKRQISLREKALYKNSGNAK